MPHPPADLIAAFVAAESVDQLAVLVVDDGFDLEAIRIIGAWMRADFEWSPPLAPCPDGGRPTRRAYAWLVEGIAVDVQTLAFAAGVPVSVARMKLAQLYGAQLLYPGGKVTKTVQGAVQNTIAKRVKPNRRES